MRRAIAVVALLVCLSGCAAFWKGVRTVADVARCLCQVVAAEQLETAPDALGGLTAEQWCEKEENLRPFIREVTSAKQAASQQAGFGR